MVVGRDRITPACIPINRADSEIVRVSGVWLVEGFEVLKMTRMGGR